jgi:hypothetical protein
MIGTAVIRAGLCECGCGKPTNIARQTRSRYGHVKGQPVAFISGHHLHGEKNPKWRGSQVGYGGVHTRLGPIRGMACFDCGGPARDWSLSTSAPKESLRVGTGGHKGLLFSLDPEAYASRCVRCHFAYDGLASRGEKNPSAKLTEAQAEEILRLVRAGGPRGYLKAIAEKFAVSWSVVYDIKARRTWAHLPTGRGAGVGP